MRGGGHVEQDKSVGDKCGVTTQMGKEGSIVVICMEHSLLQELQSEGPLVRSSWGAGNPRWRTERPRV